MILSGLGSYKNTALLIIRIGLGLLFIWHGYPKLIGGPEKWELLGDNMKYIGIDFFSIVWGFLASISEFIGGIFLIFGFAFRPACFFLLFTMIVAAIMHLKEGDGIMGASHALEDGIFFLGLLFLGPGKYSLDKK